MVALVAALGPVLGGVLACAIGWLAVRRCWPADALAGTRTLRAVLAVGLGAGAVSVLWFATLLVGRQLFGAASHVPWLVTAELLVLGALWLANRGYAAPAVTPVTGARPAAGEAALFTIALAAALVSFVLATLANPHGVVDALSIWNLRARLLFDSGPAWALAFAPELASTHPDYPLLLPGLVVRTWEWTGAATAVVPAVIAGAFWCATIGLLGAGLRQLRDARSGLLAAAAALGFPALVAVGAAQYADVPLSFYVLATLALLALHDARAPRIEPGLLWLAGACVGCAVWTKNEGVVVAVVLVVVRAVARHRAGVREVVRELAALLAGAAPVLAAWVVFKTWLVPRNDLVAEVAAGRVLDRVADPARYGEVLGALVRETWGLGPAMLVAVVVWALLHPRDRLRFPLAVCVVVLAGYLAIYVVASRNLTWHLATSLQRLLLHLLPAVLFAVFTGRARERAATR